MAIPIRNVAPHRVPPQRSSVPRPTLSVVPARRRVAWFAVTLTGMALIGPESPRFAMFAIAAGAYLTALLFIQLMQPDIRALDEG